MKRPGFLRLFTTIAVFIACLGCAGAAVAQTRLYVPQYRYGSNEDTQFLIANKGDQAATVSLWAFTDSGELLGQYQVGVHAHGTRAVTIGEAFAPGDTAVSGWIGAVSDNDGIQLSYTRLGDTSQSYEAQEWPARDVRLTVGKSDTDVVHFANPNSFAAKVTVQGFDASGGFVGTRTVDLAPFARTEMPSSSVGGGQAARLSVLSNAEIVATIDGLHQGQVPGGKKFSPPDLVSEEMSLVIQGMPGTESLGAYQVTLAFDPQAVQFSTKDVDGGTAAGFDSKPLVVNIDNAAGLITIASFQVGATPAGRSIVARLKVSHRSGSAARFGIQVDEITNTTGKSLMGSGLSVGLVRNR